MFDELRKKPKAVRQQYAFFGALAITSVIALLWLLTLSLRFDESVVVTKENPGTRGAFSQFFSDIKSQVSSSITVFKDQVANNSTSTGLSEVDMPTENSTTSVDESNAFSMKLSSTTIEEKRVGETIISSTASTSKATTSNP